MRHVAIVTGAGSGIGRALAIDLAARGLVVALVGRNARHLAETAAAIPADATEIIVADIADANAPQVIVGRVLSRWQRVDVVVNNAGIALRLPIAETSSAFIAEIMRVNFDAAARLIAAAWPTLLQQSRGLVVNVSSLAASDPFPGFFVYGASKAALESLARSIAAEKTTVVAYNIAVGSTDTAMLARLFTEADIAKRDRRPPADVARFIADVVERSLAGTFPEPSGATLSVPPSPAA